MRPVGVWVRREGLEPRTTHTQSRDQLIMMLVCWFALAPNRSVTVSVNVKVPLVVGVPSIRFPLLARITLRPGGSCPAVTAHEYGVDPPLANKFWK